VDENNLQSFEKHSKPIAKHNFTHFENQPVDEYRVKRRTKNAQRHRQTSVTVYGELLNTQN
jgi:hypothetical protein